MHFCLTMLSAASAVIAAVFWFWSAMVPYPSELRGVVPHGGRAYVATRPLVDAARKTGRLNMIAAAFSGLAALLVAADTIWQS
jgi:hypothetical protein